MCECYITHIVRVRPPNKREQSGSGGGVCVKVTDGTVRVERQPFAFDVTFPMECTQLVSSIYSRDNHIYNNVHIDVCIHFYNKWFYICIYFVVYCIFSFLQEVFESIGVDIVQCAFHGYNAALFAYGQTSSGKSFSMMGVRGTALVGLIPRISRLLFKAIESDQSKEVLVECSYMEVYMFSFYLFDVCRH